MKKIAKTQFELIIFQLKMDLHLLVDIVNHKIVNSLPCQEKNQLVIGLQYNDL